MLIFQEITLDWEYLTLTVCSSDFLVWLLGNIREVAKLPRENTCQKINLKNMFTSGISSVLEFDIGYGYIWLF